MRKWLNISTKDSDFSADTDEDDIDGDSDTEGQFNGHNFKPPFFVFSVFSWFFCYSLCVYFWLSCCHFYSK